MSKPGNDLVRGTRLMTIGTALSRVTGFGRTLALAYALGSGEVADAYNLANTAPNIVYELILGGVLAGTLLPVFSQMFATETKESAWEAISTVFTLACVVGLVLVCVLFVGAPWVIDLYTAFSHSATQVQEREVATALLRFFSVQVFFYAFISVATALLHSRRNFGPPMFAPIFNNLVVIAMLLAVPSVTNALSLQSLQENVAFLTLLGVGTTLGVAAMAALLLPYLRKVADGQLKWTWQPRHPVIAKVLRLSGWTMGFVATNQIALFVTTALAYRRDGDLTAYLYAYTFFVLPHGIFAVSVMSALQPSLSEASAKAIWDQFRHRFGQGLRLILIVIVPAAAGYAVLAHPIVDLVLLHGRYSNEAAETTAELVAFLVLGLPGFSAFLFLARSFQAMQDARIVFYLYLFENGINVATSFPLYDAMGVQGLALSHSIAYSVAAVAGFVLLRRRLGGMHGAIGTGFLIRLAVVTTVMTALVMACVSLISGALAVVAAGSLVGTVAFLGITKILGMKELNLLLRRTS